MSNSFIYYVILMQPEASVTLFETCEMAEASKAAGPDQDSSNDDFEEVFVYIDFPDFDECSFLNESTILELHDMTGAHPSCKINNLIFKGKQEVNLGSQMFFDHSDPSSAEFIGSSINVIKFRLNKIETAP